MVNHLPNEPYFDETGNSKRFFLKKKSKNKNERFLFVCDDSRKKKKKCRENRCFLPGMFVNQFLWKMLPLLLQKLQSETPVSYAVQKTGKYLFEYISKFLKRFFVMD